MRLRSSPVLVLFLVMTSACGAPSSEGSGPNGIGDAGGPDSGSFGPWRSGTRLRARVWDGGQGARLFQGWWDQQLNLNCAFRVAEDGKLRCLPDVELDPLYPAGDCTTAKFVLPYHPKGTYFSFALLPPAAKTPAPDCATRKCPPPIDPVQGVGLLGDPSDVMMVGTNGTICGCAPFSAGVGFVAFTKVPADMFVAASERVVGAPIAARVIEGEDGSMEVPWLIDQGTSSICSLASNGITGAPDVCLTTRYSSQSSDNYVAPDCTGPVVGIPPCQDPPLMIMRPKRSSQCPIAPPEVDLFSAGPPHMLGNGGSLNTFTRLEDGTCRTAETLVDPVIDRGPPLDLTSLPPLPIKELGTGRIRARFGQGSSGHSARNQLQSAWFTGRPDVIFMDSQLGAPCGPQLISDGVERCVPLNVVRPGVNYFTDAACTAPATIVTPSNGCKPPFPLVGAPSDMNMGPVPPLQALYQQGEAAATDIYVMNEKGGVCVKDDALKNQGFLLAPLLPIDLESFPIMKKALE